MASNNVVHLLPLDESESRGYTAGAELPELIQTVRRNAFKHLKSALQSLFDNVDDYLFEHTDKSKNNELQTKYFDAMREIRLKRESMTGTYFREFDRLFRLYLQGSPELKSQTGDSPGFANLSLVEEDDLELSLAKTALITKTNSLYRDSLIALAQRLDYVMEEPGLKTESHPLAARVMCESFSPVVEMLSGNVEIRLMVFKLYDKYVVQQLAGLYDEANSILVSAGILPQVRIKSAIKNAVSRPTKPDAENVKLSTLQSNVLAPAATEIEPDAGSVFGVMQQLLTRSRGDDPAAINTALEVDAASGPAHQYVMQDIITGLSGMQHADSSVQAGGIDPHTSEWIRKSLIEAIGKPGKDGTKEIDRVDSDTIDIVSMLFDFILDDKSLTDRFRASVARLQIPFIKVALLDKSFFSKKTHPARQLLNELAFSAGNQESDTNQESFHEKTEEIVGNILSEFDSDVSIFADSLMDFKTFLQQEIEDGQQARETLEHVKQQVARTIGHRVHNNGMPDFVRELLLSQWKDVMTQIGFRDGCESRGWEVASQVMDDLIWSVQPRLVVGQRSELTKKIPSILNGLQEGLTLIACPHDYIMTVFDQLESSHHESLRKSRKSSRESKRTPEPGKYKTSDQGDKSEANDEIVFPEPPDLEDYVDSQYYWLVRGMELGSRVEFIHEDSITHARLAWKCDFTHEYTFVDRKYSLVADIGVVKLLQDFEAGRMRFADEIPLLDRAFDAVVKGLRHCLNRSGQSSSPGNPASVLA